MSDLGVLLSGPEPDGIAALDRRVTHLETVLVDRALAAITELHRLTVRPDDTIIVTADRVVTAEQAVEIQSAVRRVTGHPRVIVIGAGIEISVAERES